MQDEMIMPAAILSGRTQKKMQVGRQDRPAELYTGAGVPI
jgi:hypothetical protein